MLSPIRMRPRLRSGQLSACSAVGSYSGAGLTVSKVLHYGIFALLILAGAAYWLSRPATLNPVTDPEAAQALALVQTHRAAGYPSILQAFNERVRIQQDRNLGVRLGQWRVNKLKPDPRTPGGDRYEVRINLREEGTTQWFEREFIWHVDLSTKRVNAASLPADGLMPEGPDAALFSGAASVAPKN